MLTHSRSGGPANGGSFRPLVDASGSHVAFDSIASNLADGDRNHDFDVFVTELSVGETELISRASGGESSARGDSYGSTISGDGSAVSYMSNADHLVPRTGRNLYRVYAYEVS